MAETIFNLNPLFVAVAGGVIPSLIWLWFWLKEDVKSPEPTGLIALSFFAGMAIVYFVLPIQKLVLVSTSYFVSIVDIISLKLSVLPPTEQTIQITLWALIEEVAKYATVFLIAFKSKHFDEPIDAVIYMITAALGFAAMENSLYILKDLENGAGVQALLDSNLRFIGATILHTISSIIVGAAIAFSFYAPRTIKFVSVTIGIIIASLLHAYFNLSIIDSDGTLRTLLIFSQFWAGIVGVIVLLQIVKRVKNN